MFGLVQLGQRYVSYRQSQLLHILLPPQRKRRLGHSSRTH